MIGSSVAALATWPTVGWTVRVVLLSAASALIVAALIGICFDLALRRSGLPAPSKRRSGLSWW